MIEGLALIGGVAFGIGTSFVPGVPLTLLLAFLLVLGLPTWLGGAAAVCFVASAAGAGVYARRLSAVYHPAAGDGDLASLDVSLRLTNQGRGADALRLMVLGTDIAWVPVGAFALAMVVLACAGINGARTIERALAILGGPIIVWWIVFTVYRARDRPGTVLGFCLMGVLGYAVLHAPALTGGEHQMAVLMGAVFGVPITLGLLSLRRMGLPTQTEPQLLKVNLQTGLLGACIGCLCGFLAGLGAGSLVSMAQSAAEDDEGYLLLSSAGEAANDLLALLLIVLAGVGRSGEAVLLGRVAGRLDVVAGILVFVAVAAGAWAGRKAVFTYEQRYREAVGAINPKLPAVLVLGLVALQASLTGQVAAALAFIAAGTAIALWCRERELPLQVSFGCLAIPIGLQAAGLVPVLNSLLFW